MAQRDLYAAGPGGERPGGEHTVPVTHSVVTLGKVGQVQQGEKKGNDKKKEKVHRGTEVCRPLARPGCPGTRAL